MNAAILEQKEAYREVNAITGTAGSVIFGTQSFSGLPVAELVQDFVKAFQDKYGETPMAMSALAYDCVYMYKTAIEAAGSADAAAVRDAMADTSLTYECVTGTFTLDESGTPVKGASIIAFEAGTGADGKPAVVSKLLDVVTELPQA